MADYLKLFSLGSLGILLFAYLIRYGLDHLALAINWGRAKATFIARRLYDKYFPPKIDYLKILQDMNVKEGLKTKKEYDERDERCAAALKEDLAKRAFKSVRKVSFVALLMLVAIPAFATDKYFGPATLLGGTMADCAHALIYSDATNGIGSANAQVAGTTMHLCSGTYTIGSLGTFVTFIASGSAGNPITLKWESGAIVQSTNFSVSPGAIVANSKSYIILDGGVDGILQNTDNGSSGTYGHSTNSSMVAFSVCNNCQVTNLNVVNTYVRNDPNDTVNPGSGDHSAGDAIDLGGSSNSRIDHNTVHDAQFCINWTITTDVTNIEIDHNTLSHCNWTTAIGGTSANTLNGLLWHDNDVSDWSNWDNPTDNDYHHNGIHIYTEGSAGTRSNMKLYNNYAHGASGVFMTALMYFEANTGTFDSPLIFQNVFNLGTSDGPNNGQVMFKANVTTPGVYNNYFGYVTNIGKICMETGGGTGVISKNNIFVNCGLAYYVASGSLATSDYNDFFGNTALGEGSGDNTTLAAWQASFPTRDVHSINTDPTLTAFIPTTGSPVYHTGTPLDGLGITALNTSKNGVARGSGPWTMGPNDVSGASAVFNGRTAAFFFLLALAIYSHLSIHGGLHGARNEIPCNLRNRNKKNTEIRVAVKRQ